MGLKELLELSGVILASLGGGSAIVFGFSSWLGKVWANRIMVQEKAKFERELREISTKWERELETHKERLKRYELFFNKKYEAVCELTSYLNRIIPEYSCPEMEIDDVYQDISFDLKEIEKYLENYLVRFKVVLDQEVYELIIQALSAAAEGKFIEISPNNPSAAWEEGKEVYENLRSAEGKLIESIRADAIA